MIATSYKQAFVKYAVVDLKQDIRAYRMPVLMNWLREHINQPMLKEDLYTGIMRTGVFMEYKGRAIGLNTLNEKLRSYGVQIISVSIGKHKAGNSVRWKLIEIYEDNFCTFSIQNRYSFSPLINKENLEGR